MPTPCPKPQNPKTPKPQNPRVKIYYWIIKTYFEMNEVCITDFLCVQIGEFEDKVVLPSSSKPPKLSVLGWHRDLVGELLTAIWLLLQDRFISSSFISSMASSLILSFSLCLGLYLISSISPHFIFNWQCSIILQVSIHLWSMDFELSKTTI